MATPVKTKLLKATEVASTLGVTTRTVWKLVDRRALPRPVHVGRVARWKESWIVDYVNRLEKNRR